MIVNDTDDLVEVKDDDIEIYQNFDVPYNAGSQHNDTRDSSDVSSTDCQTPNKEEAESTATDPLRLQSHLSVHVLKNHPSSNIIGDLNSKVTTRKKDKLGYAKMIANVCFTSNIEPRNVTEALKDEQWVKAM